MKSHAQIVSEHMRVLGSKGGKSRSEAKQASGKVNAAKALAARMAKRENSSK